MVRGWIDRAVYILKVVMGSLNPFTPLLAYRRQRDIELDRQREADRMERAEQAELLRATITTMGQMVEKAFDVVKAQGDVQAKWLMSFETGAAPQVREWDEDADTARYMQRKGGQAPRAQAKTTLPAELVGLDRLQQFEALLDRMGS